MKIYVIVKSPEEALKLARDISDKVGEIPGC